MDPDQLKPLLHSYGSFAQSSCGVIARRSIRLGTAPNCLLAKRLPSRCEQCRGRPALSNCP